MRIGLKLKVIALVTLGAVSGLSPGKAQVDSVTVLIDGMACPFCAFGIEKRLKKVEGVGAIEVDLDASSALLTASEGASIAYWEIPQQVQKAGFTPGNIRLTAVGTIIAAESGRTLFRVGGTDEDMLLVNLSAEIQSKIEELASAGTKVRLSGVLHLHAEELAGLEPDSVEIVAS